MTRYKLEQSESGGAWHIFKRRFGVWWLFDAVTGLDRAVDRLRQIDPDLVPEPTRPPDPPTPTPCFALGCECHKNMGNDFYFLPTGSCIRRDGKCTKGETK